MPNLLARGAAVLKAKQEAHASETVCVTRGDAVLIDDWDATPARTAVTTIDESGTSVTSEQFDWLGNVLQWGLNGERKEPQSGDVIWWDRGDYVDKFEVQPADGDNTYSPSGPFGDRVRVHTKFIERIVK